MVMGVYAEGITCAEMCWRAVHEKCVCSCGGKNHGIMRTSADGSIEGEQPVRTKRVRQWRYRLVTVTENKQQAIQFCRERGHRYVRSTVGKYAWGPDKFLATRATASQLAKWPECEGFTRGYTGWKSAHIIWVLEDYEIPEPVTCAACGKLDAPFNFKTFPNSEISKQSHRDYGCESYEWMLWR